MQAPTSHPAGTPTGAGKAKPRRRGSASGQTAKKRELDRIAQKKSRERARNRMAELEEKIRRLQSDDKQKQISELMRQIEDLKGENEKLRSMTEKIRSLTETIGPTFKAIEAPPPILSRRRSSSDSESNTDQVTSPDNQTITNDQWWDNEASSNDSPEGYLLDPIPVTATYPPEPVLDLYVPPVNEINPSFDFVPSFAGITDFESALSVGTPGQLCLGKIPGVVPDHEKWRTSNNAFIFGIDKTRKMSHAETAIINSHAAYKAILWGHDARDDHERNHPLWLALRQVDEKVFGNWERKAQKVAMMFVCQRMLLYKSNPCAETLARVPTFLRPRPSQETIQHPAVIDFLIWPGLRDRLVFSHKRYTSTGDFSAAFCENLRFNWPFSDEQILLFDHQTQTYRISPVFQEYAFDMKNWTMDEGFFEQYMEMRHDIPSTDQSRGTGAGPAFSQGYYGFMPASD